MVVTGCQENESCSKVLTTAIVDYAIDLGKLLANGTKKQQLTTNGTNKQNKNKTPKNQLTEQKTVS